MALATDRGTVPMHVAAVLRLDPEHAPMADALKELLADRLRGVPRLGDRLTPTPWGAGRPVWAPAPHHRPERQLEIRSAAAAEEDALAQAMALVLRPLPRDRPLWRVGILADATGRATDLVVVLHHVVADGIGGLAVLAGLADGAPAHRGSSGPSPQPAAHPIAPDTRTLVRDAWAERGRALRRLPAGARGLVAGARELGGGHGLAERTSLLTPTSPRRRVDVVEAPLDDVHSAARGQGATVNDWVLAAVAAAVGDVLRARGERLEELVVSVPVSSRASASAQELGNAVGVMPIRIPLSGDRSTRLAAIRAQRERVRSGAPRGSSGPLLATAFRGLAAVGLFQPFVARQRLVHTFETNVRGPSRPLALGGVPITRIVPVAVNPGNVTVSFGVLSYAGRLLVSVLSDPDHVPEHDLLRHRLVEELGSAPYSAPDHEG